tara:strand:+ start:478 stop:714 length:237 start_codon:yes stop_codon:yes gene_type:complete
MSKVQKKSKSLNHDEINLSLGKNYYNVMEVFKNKLVTSIIERSEDLNLSRDSLEKISFVVGAEIDSAKSWGYDQLKIK